MRSLLVTGGSGYLGGELLRRAPPAGWRVTGTHFSDPAPGTVALDVRDARTVRRLARDADAVVHTAYRQHGEDAAAINVEGARAVAEAAQGKRLVHLSSDLVFRGALGRPLREDDPIDPITGYGATKAQAECVVAGAHPDALLVRTSLIYGGVEPSNHERFALQAARGERQATFFTNEQRSPIHVGDLAAAILELLDLDLSGPLHVAGADPVDRYEFACLVVAAAGLDPSVLRAGDSGPDRPADCALDSSRAQSLLTTRLRGTREVLGS